MDSVTVGTKIKVNYQLFNDRTKDYKELQLTEKENWHSDFADIVAHITGLAAKVATLDINSMLIRDVRAKKLAFEGLRCIAVLHVYTINSLDPIKVTTYEFSLPAETKLQITHEAEKYIMTDKRRQGDLFALGEAIVKNKKHPEQDTETEKEEPEMQLA